MAGKTTFYSRLQVILDLAGKRKPRSASEFVQGVVQNSPPNFVYHFWDAEKEKVVPRCSETAVMRTVQLANDLGLLHRDSGALTGIGKEAADTRRYDMILRQRIESHLSELGCPLENITSKILEILRAPNPILPTIDELYTAVCKDDRIGLSESDFGALLRLLATCGGITMSRRHIFLPKTS